jgi:hypothetical protein
MNGVVMVAAFGLSDVELDFDGFLVRLVVCVVVLVAGTTDVSGVPGLDMCEEMAQIRAPARIMTTTATASRTAGFRYHATRGDGGVAPS